jgi:hypothetical protein
MSKSGPNNFNHDKLRKPIVKYFPKRVKWLEVINKNPDVSNYKFNRKNCTEECKIKCIEVGCAPVVEFHERAADKGLNRYTIEQYSFNVYHNGSNVVVQSPRQDILSSPNFDPEITYVSGNNSTSMMCVDGEWWGVYAVKKMKNGNELVVLHNIIVKDWDHTLLNEVLSKCAETIRGLND